MIKDNYGAHKDLDVKRHVNESRGGIVPKLPPVRAPRPTRSRSAGAR